MSDRMEQLIQEHRLIPPGSTVLCAVSGGADSVYLLHRLYCLRRELDFTLVAAHYDHRLRGAESTQDAKFVEEFVRLCCPAERLYTPEGPGKELPGVRLITGGGDVAGEAARLRQCRMRPPGRCATPFSKLPLKRWGRISSPPPITPVTTPRRCCST